jgi:hypothetical protein
MKLTPQYLSQSKGIFGSSQPAKRGCSLSDKMKRTSKALSDRRPGWGSALSHPPRRNFLISADFSSGRRYNVVVADSGVAGSVTNVSAGPA